MVSDTQSVKKNRLSLLLAMKRKSAMQGSAIVTTAKISYKVSSNNIAKGMFIKIPGNRKARHRLIVFLEEKRVRKSKRKIKNVCTSADRKEKLLIITACFQLLQISIVTRKGADRGRPFCSKKLFLCQKRQTRYLLPKRDRG